jgi:four helix bundle suffix protein
VVGNVMVCLCNQACFLLGQQIRELEQAFLQEGGIRERMMRAREEVREAKGRAVPVCPLCGKRMRERTACQGKNAGNSFWGCSAYPECRGTRPVSPVLSVPQNPP